MAKKQLAKAALDRIKRSAKDGYPKKKPKNKFKVISSKTVSKGKDYAKNVVTSPSKLKVKGPKESSKPFVRGAIAGGATVGLASGAGKKQSKAKESTTKNGGSLNLKIISGLLQLAKSTTRSLTGVRQSTTMSKQNDTLMSQ